MACLLSKDELLFLPPLNYKENKFTLGDVCRVNGMKRATGRHRYAGGSRERLASIDAMPGSRSTAEDDVTSEHSVLVPTEVTSVNKQTRRPRSSEPLLNRTCQ